MEPFLWLLLPVAALSGWITAKLSNRKAQPDPGHTNPFSQHCIQGLNYLLSEQSDKAIQHLVEMVDVDEDTVETHLVLGSLFRRRGEVDRAIRIHQNIIARPSLSPQQRSNALLQLGLDYLKAGLLDRAEAIFLQLADTGFSKQEAYDYLASVYEQEKEWSSAIKAVSRLEKAGGESQVKRLAHYHCELAEKYMRERRADLAKQEVKLALVTDDECIRAYIQSGDLHLSRGERKEALRAFAHGLQRDHYFSPIILKHLYDYFSTHGELKHLIDFINHHADCRKDAAARFFLVRSYDELGEAQEVDELLHEELNREEASPYIIKSFLEMMSQRTSGETSSSFRALERVLSSRLSTYMACQCKHCGFESNAIFWQCPSCQNWGTVRPYPNPLEYTWLDREVT